MLKKIPLKNPKPDCEKFIQTMLGKTSSTPPLAEYIIDDVVQKPIVTELLGRPWAECWGDKDSREAYLDNFIELWYRMGYDFVRFERGLNFTRNVLFAEDESFGKGKQRAWVDEHAGSITSLEDFKKYSWPRVSDFDFSSIEYISKHLPEGMGFISCHAAGIFEHLSAVMSYEGLSFALLENPELVKLVVDKIGELMCEYYENLLKTEKLIAVFQGDDMGYKTGTMISPSDLRKYCLPWQKRFAEMAHRNKIPYFLHSCGNLSTIMEDLIEDVKIDGKHSYEDVIIPIEKFQEKYGSRIAVLGGVDVNLLASGSPDDVRKRTRFLLETCGGKGRFAVGAGNSIASYIPVDNYLAMVDEANEFKLA